ncbi:hypothetical protein MRBLBA21_001534 [Peribacillus frigoritolerans]|uniref:hypothetical protein n=1 Tax=Peribacillus frigoritolerans TaxID=450367 RepID=UPI00341C86D4
MNTLIDTYIQDVLPSFFKKYNIPDDVIGIVANDIETRIYSCLSHWNDFEFRRVLLTTGLEEANFYEPRENIELRCFVVVAIRNSLFENLVSNRKAAMELGLKTTPIPDNDVKLFTQGAITHFKNIDFKMLCNNLSMADRKDIYIDLKEKYPVAWNALSELGKWSNKAQVFDSLQYGLFTIEELQQIPIIHSEKKITTDIQSGIDDKLDKGLLEFLNGISLEQQPVFYTDCFKMLTRNIDKLLKVIEYVLRRECTFMTSNFYISNGYVAKRKDLIRPAHTTKDMEGNLNQFGGLRHTHLKAFKAVSQSMRG